jgi:SAM-dependent methyltransferase
VTPHLQRVWDDVQARHRPFLAGINEAREVDPQRFAELAEMSLDWLVQVSGPDVIPVAVDAFVEFTTAVNLAQARYEQTGRYEHRSYAELYASQYSRDDQMQTYLWGSYLTNFLWGHHVEIWLQFDDRFAKRLPADAEIVELGSGHGWWGALALRRASGARLRGFDVSGQAIQIAESMARAAGVAERATYAQLDALALDQPAVNPADACICCFLVEHLEEPDRLFAVISGLLRPGGRAFVTGALTAPHTDHIAEFRRESELVLLAEAQGLRVVESFSANPKRLLRKARFIPRSMAMILEQPRTGLAR